jgi:hypothetical protein
MDITHWPRKERHYILLAARSALWGTAADHLACCDVLWRETYMWLCRWRVSDLGGSDAQIALFGEAHKEHYSQVRQQPKAFMPACMCSGVGCVHTAGEQRYQRKDRFTAPLCFARPSSH